MKLQEAIPDDLRMKVLENIVSALFPLLQSLKHSQMDIFDGLPIRIHTDVGYVTFSKPFGILSKKQQMRITLAQEFSKNSGKNRNKVTVKKLTFPTSQN